jgi:hypothetical protein
MQHGRQPAGIGVACTVHKLECLLTVSRQCHCSASKLTMGLLAGKPAGAIQCATLCFGGWQRLPHCLAVWQQGARLSQNYSQKVAFVDSQGIFHCTPLQSGRCRCMGIPRVDMCPHVDYRLCWQAAGDNQAACGALAIEQLAPWPVEFVLCRQTECMRVQSAVLNT